jgi:hypothetical protein
MDKVTGVLTSFEKYNKLTIANVYTTFLENLVAI